MVEKIIINPTKVRAYGNIMSPHSSSDYSLEDCTIEAGTDTVNGATETVYTLTPTLSHSYSLSFGSASYAATGGACTVSVTLTDNSTPVNNASISVTGGTGGTGTGTTNSSGVATINVTGITASGTLTASFSGVTATASVTVSSYIIDDDASVDNSATLFASSISLRNSGTATATYNNNGYYVITNTTGSAETFIEYKPLQGITDSFKVTTQSQSTGTDVCGIALYYYIDNNNWGGVKEEGQGMWISTKTNGTFTETNKYSNTAYKNLNIKNEFIYDANAGTLTINRYDKDNPSTIFKTYTMNIPITITSGVKWGTTTSWNNNTTRKLYSIKAEAI